VERRFRGQSIQEIKGRLWTGGHSHCDSTVQFHNGRLRELRELIVERNDAHPVCVSRRNRLRVTGGDRGLHRVRATSASKLLGPRERGNATTDEELIPLGAVLIEEQEISRTIRVNPAMSLGDSILLRPVLHLHHLPYQQMPVAQGAAPISNLRRDHVTLRQEVAPQAACSTNHPSADQASR
jgi:hypothetical protein